MMGLACDAILRAAKAHGAAVSSGSVSTASFTGRARGRAILWTINPGAGIGSWLRRD